jgi:hypothetical protein
MKAAIVETLLLSTIVIILLILLYNYLGKNKALGIISEQFTDSISTLFDTEEMEHHLTPEWSNFTKNYVTQTELPISIWKPAITDYTSYKMIGHTVHNLYVTPASSVTPVVIKIKNTIDTPLPTKLNKVFEFGTNAATTSSYTRNIYTKDDYDNFLTGTDINYKTTIPITYTTIEEYSDSFHYDNNPNSGIIYEIDYSKASIKQITDEIAACNQTLLSNNTFLTNYFKNIYKQKKVIFYNPNYWGTTYPYTIDPAGNNDVPLVPESINYYNWIQLRVPKGVTVELFNWGSFQRRIINIVVPLEPTIKELSDKYTYVFRGGVKLLNDGDVFFEGCQTDINSFKITVNTDTISKLVERSDMNSKLVTHINNLNKQLTIMNNFKNAILNKSIEIPAFSCWEPVAPENHIAIGHVICPLKNIRSNDLAIETLRTQIACIPIHCYRKVRDWVASDIVYRYNKNGLYFAFYKNPFTNTFLVTTNQAGPSGFVGKVIICPKKDYTIDNIIAFDSKIRNNCSNYKNITNKSQLVSNDYNNDEDSYLQTSIYNKEKKIQELKTYADSLEIANSKGDIINQEFNRVQLSSYLDKQRDRIDTALSKLEAGRNKIDINVKYPASIIIQLIDYVSNSPDIPIEKKVEVVATLKQIQNSSLSNTDARKNIIAALTTCPQFDLSNYIKKDPPCFGCYLSS